MQCCISPDPVSSRRVSPAAAATLRLSHWPCRPPSAGAVCSVTAATHAIISLMASFYILVRRDVRHCGDRAFCFDDMTGRLWTVHAGFCLYDFVFWQNNGSLVRPWNEMLLLHDTVWLLQGVISLVRPAGVCPDGTPQGTPRKASRRILHSSSSSNQR